MINLERLNKSSIAVNPLLIETIEETPDTVIILNSGRKLVVKNSLEDIQGRIDHYYSKIISESIIKIKRKK